MIVKIKRQRTPDSAPYWQSFSYSGPLHVTISAVLDAINYTDDLFDTEGNPATRVKWECSCLQAVCGGCAMIINGVPALACNTFVDEVTKKDLVLEPLSKFPVVADLIVDRGIIYENLNSAKAYIESCSVSSKQNHAHQYSVAKCLKCGLCLEVCPNYVDGHAFYGALFANDCYLVAAKNPGKAENVKESYRTHFGNGCSKALSCVDVCPMQIPTIASMAKLNRS